MIFAVFLSTPSARRATQRQTLAIASIKFLSTPSARRATSCCWSKDCYGAYQFLSTPSARRATADPTPALNGKGDFYPRPPRGGRLLGSAASPPEIVISIHALREEGDIRHPPLDRYVRDFYPRPPRGGRHCRRYFFRNRIRFLSTPSARRATDPPLDMARGAVYFYPRPPRGGRRERLLGSGQALAISIHALREEGDRVTPATGSGATIFLSTPSARRATLVSCCTRRGVMSFLSTPSARRATIFTTTSSRHFTISIHALREEGDGSARPRRSRLGHFYPRPPRGGRPVDQQRPAGRENFYPRPPRGGRPRRCCRPSRSSDISIHALREEGDS